MHPVTTILVKRLLKNYKRSCLDRLFRTELVIIDTTSQSRRIEENLVRPRLKNLIHKYVDYTAQLIKHLERHAAGFRKLISDCCTRVGWVGALVVARERPSSVLR